MTQLLTQLSRDLVASTERAGHSLVRVEGRDRLPFSGIVWGPDLVVTADHGLERERPRVGLPDGQRVEAVVVGRDRGTDLALLRVPGARLEPAVWAEPDRLKTGMLVLAIGRPAERPMVSLGVIAALNGPWRTPTGGQIDHWLQTDVVMFPGFSGGALVEAEGRFAGLITSGFGDGQSLAIPVGTLRRTVRALLDHGRVRRGYLGVELQPVTLPERLQREHGQQTGLLLMGFAADGPAERSGLMLGDTLVRLNGQPLTRLEDLLAVLGPDTVNQQLTADIVRAGALHSVAVWVAERPQ